MPDSEHPDGGDSSEVVRRPGGESPAPPRRSRTSTADRPARAARPRTAADPRTEGSRTPPRRAKSRATPESEDDVAAALARVPDAHPAGNGTGTGTSTTTSTSNGNGTSKRNGSGKAAAARADAPADVPAPDSSADGGSVHDPGLALAGVDDDASSEVGAATAAESGAAVSAVDTAVAEPDAEQAPTEQLAAVDAPTDEVAVVEPDLAAADTVVLPVVEPDEVLPHEPEFEPRIYDVETDEPGAYVALVPAVTEPVETTVAPAVETEPEPVLEEPAERRRLRRRPRVRRVTRVIRHIDTWTVFKVLAIVNLVVYAAAMISGVLLWNVAHGTGTIDNVERFMESFGWETFTFNGEEIFDAAWRIGLFAVLGMTGLGVLAATTFNLVTDLVGGIRVTVLEEEVVVAAPPLPRRDAGDAPA